MTALIAGLLAWIAAHTAYDAAAAGIPAVRVVDDVCAELDLEPPCGVAAWYDHRSATIGLRRGWTGDSLEDRSLLLHELIHHVQAAVGAFDFDSPLARCRGESEAFALMARWMAENGERARLDVRKAVRDACAGHFIGGAAR